MQMLDDIVAGAGDDSLSRRCRPSADFYSLLGRPH